MPKTITQQMAALREESGTLDDQMSAVLQAADENNEGRLTEEQEAEYGAAELRFNEIHGAPIDGGDRQGGLLSQLQVEEGRRQQQTRRTALMQRSTRLVAPSPAYAPGDRSRQGTPLVIGDDSQFQMVSMTRAELRDQQSLDACCFLRAIAAAQMNYDNALIFVRNGIGNQRVADVMEDWRDARQQMGTGTGVGGEWIPPGYVPALIELLRPASVVRASGATVAPLVNGTLTLPKIAAGAAAGYTAENADIGATELTSADVKFSAKKLTALVPMSNDLIRYSDPSADVIVRDDLVRAVAQAEDIQFIRGTGTATAPTSLYETAPAGNKKDQTGVTLAAVDKDLGDIRLFVIGANVPLVNPGWLMSPRSWNFLNTLRDGNGNKAFPETDQGSLKGHPLKTTTQIPDNLGVGTNESEIYFCSFGQAVIAEDPQMGVEASSVAAYYDGSAVVAAFSRDQTVMRIIRQQDFNMRHDLATGVLEAVTYGA